MKTSRKLTAVSLILAIILITASGAFAEDVGPTEPEKVTIDTAVERLETLCKALDGKFFTVSQGPCGYGLPSHGCSNCYNRNVISAGWLEELGLTVPDDDQYMPRQYDPWGDDGWPNGYTCYGFANYVNWYVFSQKPTDNITGVFIGSCEFTYEAMLELGVCPGDILRIEPMYHSVVFLGYDGTEGIHTVDCNMRYYNDSANSRVRLTDFKFDSSQKIGVTGAANYTRTSTVCVKEIKITSTESGVMRGESLQLTCDIRPEDAVLKTVKWCVIPGTGDASVTETGLVTGTKAGTVTIGAEALDGGGAYGKITIEILPIPAEGIYITSGKEVVRGQELELTAGFEPKDCDPDPSKIVWTSSDPETASVEDGVLTGLKTGEVTVTAAYGELMAECDVTVLPLRAESLEISGAEKTVNKETVQYTVVSDPEDADIEGLVFEVIPKTGEASIDDNGLLTAVKAGDVTVRVSLKEDPSVYDETLLRITKRYVDKLEISGEATVIKLSENTYTAASTNGADDESVSWSVKNVTGEATVTKDGVLTGTKAGEVILRANALDGSGKYEEMKITVMPLNVGSLVIEGEDSVRRLQEMTLTAKLLPEGCDFDPSLIEWSSSNEKILTVEDGLVKGLATGKATVYVTYENIIASMEVTVTPIPAENVKVSGASSVIKTEQSVYVFSVLPENADNRNAVWSVKNGTGEAVIDDKGVLTAVKAGTVTVCASSESDPDVYGELEITVLPLKVSSLTMTGEETAVKTYLSRYSVKALPENADDKSVTWTVIPGTGDATVEDGVLTGTKTGDVTLRAVTNDGSDIYAEMKIEILKLDVKSVSISSPSGSVTYGSVLKLTGSVSPEQADVPGITWSVSDERVAVIDQNGVLTPVSAGYVTVVASSVDNPDITATYRVNVVPREVTAIRLESLEAYTGKTLRAVVIPADATGTFEWYADGEKIEGAEGSEYTVSFEDSGKKIFARFTGNKNYTGTVDTLLTQKSAANITSEVPKAHSIGSSKDTVIRVSPDLEYLSSLRIDAACDTHIVFEDLEALPEGVSLEQGSTVLTLSAAWMDENLPEGTAEVTFGYLNDTVTYKAAFEVNPGIFNPKTGAALKFIIPLAVIVLTLAGWMMMRKKKTA